VNIKINEILIFYTITNIMINMSEVELPKVSNGDKLDFLKVDHVKGGFGKEGVTLSNVRIVPTQDFGKQTKSDKVWIDVTSGDKAYSWIPNQTSIGLIQTILGTNKGSELEGKRVNLIIDQDKTYKQDMIVPSKIEVERATTQVESGKIA